MRSAAAQVLPPQQVLHPTANGTYTEWGELFGSGTTHWDRVDDVTPDDSGSYIMDNTWNGTERDTFQLSDTSYTTIGSVEVVARGARITTNDNNNVRLYIRSGSTDNQSPVEPLTMSWGEVSYSWTTDPATGQPWTQAGVNALQAGVQNAMGGSGGGGVGVTQVYVVVSNAAQVLRPIANGTYSEWGELFGAGTTHWDRLDEVTPDDSGSYIFDNTWNGTERDTFQMSDTTYSAIASVEVVARGVRITTNDNNNVRLYIRSGSTDNQSPVQALSTAWNDVSYTWATDPATGQAWTQQAVNALQAGVQNAMGDSNPGGVGVTQVYVVVSPGIDPVWSYPNSYSGASSIGADTQNTVPGASYSRWADAGAAVGFSVQINGLLSDQNEYDLEIADAASAYQVGVPVYIYFCIYPPKSLEFAPDSPGTSLTDLANFAKALQDAGVYDHINNSSPYAALYVVFDMEDSGSCGPWTARDNCGGNCAAGNGSLQLSEVGYYENVLHYAAQAIVNDAEADGLSSAHTVYFSTTPGINAPFNPPSTLNGTDLLANYVANAFALPSTGRYFPQLFYREYVGDDNLWRTNTGGRLLTFKDAGLAYSQVNPNWESVKVPACASQDDINTIQDVYEYLTAGENYNYTWYAFDSPFCVQ